MPKFEKYLMYHEAPKKLEKAVILIQQKLYHKKLKSKRLARELRKKLKEVPMPCRAGFIKMNDLRSKTKKLENDMVNRRAEIRMM